MALTTDVEQEGLAATERGTAVTASTLSRPMPSKRYCWIACALFSFSFLYLCLFRHFTTMEPDEGILLQGAQRILRGEVLYRDFFSFYTPGSYYGLALLFRIFGSSIVVARVALAFSGALFSTIVYVLARRVCRLRASLAPSLLCTVTTLPFRFLVLHNWDSTLLACAALYCAIRLLEKPAPLWAFAVGSFVALTMLFEQSKGVGLCFGLALAYVSISYLRKGFLYESRCGMALLIGVIWPFAIAIGYFGSHNALGVMMSDWIWPLHHYSNANRVPYGYQNWSDESRHMLFGTGSPVERFVKVLAISPCFWIPILPLIGLGLLGYWIIKGRRCHPADQKYGYYIIACGAYTGIWVSTIATRADIIHFMYLQPLNCLLLAWLLDARDIPGQLLRTVRRPLAAYVVISLTVLGLGPLLGALSAHHPLTTHGGIVTTPMADSVVDYVQAHRPVGGNMLVYPYLPLYYYLTGTFSPVRYDYFQPGMHSEQQGQEITNTLEEKHLETVLFEISFPEKIPHSWPATPVRPIVRDAIADYILLNYRTCATLHSPLGWTFAFMIRKENSCP